jgi:hypothetical protein
MQWISFCGMKIDNSQLKRKDYRRQPNQCMEMTGTEIVSLESGHSITSCYMFQFGKPAMNMRVKQRDETDICCC